MSCFMRGERPLVYIYFCYNEKVFRKKDKHFHFFPILSFTFMLICASHTYITECSKHVNIERKAINNYNVASNVHRLSHLKSTMDNYVTYQDMVIF